MGAAAARFLTFDAPGQHLDGVRRVRRESISGGIGGDSFGSADVRTAGQTEKRGPESLRGLVEENSKPALTEPR